MSKVRSDNYVDRLGTGAPTFPNGVNITGVLTATTIGGTTDTILIPGNLKVDGTQTIINTETLDVADKTVGVASTASASNTTAADAGLIVYGGTDGDKTLLYDNRHMNKKILTDIIYSLYFIILFIDLFNIIISDIYLIKVLIIHDNKKAN